MMWYQALLLTVEILVSLGAVFIGPILLVNLFDRLLENHRRQKHPEYFKYWDAALEKSFARGAEYNRRKEYFDYKFRLYSLGLRDGECTNEYYTKKMNALMVEYQELCDWFQEKEKEISELLVKADLYAKEHGLTWGIIYDSKS